MPFCGPLYRRVAGAAKRLPFVLVVRGQLPTSRRGQRETLHRVLPYGSVFCHLLSCAARSTTATSRRIPTSPNYVREVPQVAGHAKHVPRRRFPPLSGAIARTAISLSLQYCTRNRNSRGVGVILKPSASIVMSQSGLFLGARMGVTPTFPGPNKRE